MIYGLWSVDDEASHWLFYCDDRQNRLVVRPEYRDLTCSGCGKVNESEALRRGVSTGFVVRSQKDWIGTAEGWVCVSQRFRDVVEQNDIGGLSFLTIPSNSGHFVVEFTCLVSTNADKAGFDCKNPCVVCGRYQEKLVGPFLESMTLPEAKKTVFVSEQANENVKAAYRPAFADRMVVKLLRESNIVGIDFVEAL